MVALLKSSDGPREWGVDFFRYDARAEDERERVSKMDIVGRSRYLVWGPYDALPPGLWQATVRFSMDEWACRHQFAVEFGQSNDFNRIEFKTDRAGMFEIDIEFEAPKIARSEVRIFLNQSSLGGWFEFFGATIQRITP